MDLIKIDTELNVKIVECYKILLKNEKIKIFFDTPSDNILEISTIELNEYKFNLLKKEKEITIDTFNSKYLNFLTKKSKLKLNELNTPQKIIFINKKKILNLLRPFLGKKYKNSTVKNTIYRIQFNGIIIELNKKQYDKLNYYTKFVYKLQQLYKLNKILDINTKYKVVFDDDEISKEMYNSIYDSFKDIIKPPNN